MMIKILICIGMSIVQPSATAAPHIHDEASPAYDLTVHDPPTDGENEGHLTQVAHVAADEVTLVSLLDVAGFHMAGLLPDSLMKALRETSATTALLVDRFRRPFIHKRREGKPHFTISRFLRAAAPRGVSEVALTYFSRPFRYRPLIAYYMDIHQNSVRFKRMKLTSDSTGFDTEIEFTMDFNSELFPLNFDQSLSYRELEIAMLHFIMRNAVQIHSVTIMNDTIIDTLTPYLHKTEKIIMKTLPNPGLMGILADWAKQRVDQSIPYEWIISNIRSAMIRNVGDVYAADCAEHFEWVTSVKDLSLNRFAHQLDPRIFESLSINSQNFDSLNGGRLAEFKTLETINLGNVNIEILLTIPTNLRLNIKELCIAIPFPLPIANIILQFPNLSRLFVSITDISEGPLDLGFINQLPHLHYLYASDEPRDVVDDDFEVLEVLLPERLNVAELDIYCLQPVNPVILTNPKIKVGRWIPGRILFEGNTHITVKQIPHLRQLPELLDALPMASIFTGPTEFFLDSEADDDSELEVE